MEPEQIEIRITVNRDEAADMTYGQRERWLGKLAEEQLAEVLPPRPPLTGGNQRNRWKPLHKGEHCAGPRRVGAAPRRQGTDEAGLVA